MQSLGVSLKLSDFAASQNCTIGQLLNGRHLERVEFETQLQCVLVLFFYNHFKNKMPFDDRGWYLILLRPPIVPQFSGKF